MYYVRGPHLLDFGQLNLDALLSQLRLLVQVRAYRKWYPIRVISSPASTASQHADMSMIHKVNVWRHSPVASTVTF